MNHWLIRLGAMLALALSLGGCGYNDFQRLDEQTKSAWSEVVNQYQRRADLIPNLVNTVKGYAAHEQQVLTAVTEARAKASSISVNADDPASLAQFQSAQGELSGALSRLMVVVENYPNLKADQSFVNLQTQLEGTENRINVSVQDYNGAVQDYNTTIRTFPDIIGAKIVHGAQPMTPYKAITPNANQAPKVDFGK